MQLDTLPAAETGVYSVELNNNYIQIDIKEPTELTIELAKEIVTARKSLSLGTDTPILFIANNLKAISKDAGEYLASKEGAEDISRIAIISDKILTNIIINSWYYFNKPEKPFKLFSSKNEAIKWLFKN